MIRSEVMWKFSPAVPFDVSRNVEPEKSESAAEARRSLQQIPAIIWHSTSVLRVVCGNFSGKL